MPCVEPPREARHSGKRKTKASKYPARKRLSSRCGEARIQLTRLQQFRGIALQNRRNLRIIIKSIDSIWHVVAPTKNLVCCRTSTLVELINEDGEYGPYKSNEAEQPETIKERQNAGLLLQQGVNLGHSAHGCVSCGITVSDEAICNVLHILRKRSIETREVCHQHRLVVLSAPREHRRHERNAKASTLIAEKVGEARRFVVFVLGQKGVGELASWDKQEGDPEALHRACPSFFSVVGCKIETREVPHGAPEDGETQPNHPGHRNPLYQSHDQRCHNDDHHRART